MAAALQALRELGPRRLIAVFQPHLYSRTKALAERFGSALAAADEVGVLDVYPARERPVGPLEGVSGLAVARAAADRASGRPVWWLVDAEPSRARPGAAAAGGRRPGDDRRRRHLRARRCSACDESRVTGAPDDADGPEGVERDYPLARLTTVRAGGPADLFARPEDEEELAELLRWAASEGIAVGVVGSGSNLLVSDDGYRGLVLKLDGRLAAIERQGTRLVCGGGARLPSAAAQAARWGLVRARVRDQHPRDGRRRREDERQRLRRASWAGCWSGSTCAPPRASSGASPSQLGFAYRRSNLGPGEVVSQASFRLAEGEVAEIKGRLAEMRGKRREAQPSGIKTFGSTFKNPADDARAGGRTAGQLLEAAGCRGLQVGGARFSEKHANFVENAGGATTADILALMAEGRRRVHERFGVSLEPEVQVLGEVEWPAAWDLDELAESRRIRAGATPVERESPSRERHRRHGRRQAARQRAHEPSPARHPSGAGDERRLVPRADHLAPIALAAPTSGHDPSVGRSAWRRPWCAPSRAAGGRCCSPCSRAPWR